MPPFEFSADQIKRYPDNFKAFYNEQIGLSDKLSQYCFKYFSSGVNCLYDKVVPDKLTQNKRTNQENLIQ